MSEEEIRKAAGEYMDIPSVKAAIKCGDVEDLASHIKVAYANGMRYVLENQWHDVNKGDLPYKHTELLDDCEGTVYVFCISKKNTPYADYMLQSSKDGHWFWVSIIISIASIGCLSLLYLQNLKHLQNERFRYLWQMPILSV